MRVGPTNVFGVSELRLTQNTVPSSDKAGYFHTVSVVAIDEKGNEQEIATLFKDGYGEESRIQLSTDYTGVVDG
jgi:hypothetical protein